MRVTHEIRETARDTGGMRGALADRMRLSFVLCALPLLFACGGATEASFPAADASSDAMGNDIAEGGSDGGAHLSDGGDWIGRDSGLADASSAIACGHMTCTGGRVCVVTTSSGGPCVQPLDGGVCPNGSPWTGGCCDNTSTTYACEALPSSCHGQLACPCAESLCQCGGCRIAAEGVLACSCQYP